MNIRIDRVPDARSTPDAADLSFGRSFTDHMAVLDWNAEDGWHDARIVPFAPIAMHPASVVLHYGAEIFEGMKAYRRPDGGVQLFRPRLNARRMVASAERMGLPPLPEADFLELLEAFTAVEADRVPHSLGASLYLRPFMYANEETLAVVTSVRRARFMIIASPVGTYYPRGIAPIRVFVEDSDVRAVRGGTGHVKSGGNYGAATRASARAVARGYDQVLWLDALERKDIEEVGFMNVMFKVSGEILTPALSGSILPGVTRQSAIELLRAEGYPVREMKLPLTQILEAATHGTLEEAWGCGTAAAVAPIGTLATGSAVYPVGPDPDAVGPTTQWLYDTLIGIQTGHRPDPFDWTVPVTPR